MQLSLLFSVCDGCWESTHLICYTCAAQSFFFSVCDGCFWVCLSVVQCICEISGSSLVFESVCCCIGFIEETMAPYPQWEGDGEIDIHNDQPSVGKANIWIYLGYPPIYAFLCVATNSESVILSRWEFLILFQLYPFNMTHWHWKKFVSSITVAGPAFLPPTGNGSPVLFVLISQKIVSRCQLSTVNSPSFNGVAGCHEHPWACSKPGGVFDGAESKSWSLCVLAPEKRSWNMFEGSGASRDFEIECPTSPLQAILSLCAVWSRP